MTRADFDPTDRRLRRVSLGGLAERSAADAAVQLTPKRMPARATA